AARVAATGKNFRQYAENPRDRVDMRRAIALRKRRKPGRKAGLRVASAPAWAARQVHLAMCSFDRLVPISRKVVTIWLAEVSRKNLLASLAQFCSSVEVASPSVLTWIV